MKALVIYKSIHHGNTEKVARGIAEVLGAEMRRVEDVERDEIKEYDLIGFGSGIFFGRHHISMIKFIDSLPHINGKRAFIFSTKGGTPTWLNHRTLRKKLKEKGFEIVGEFSCRGYDTFSILKYIGGINKGRPDERDVEKARDFARRIFREMNRK